MSVTEVGRLGGLIGGWNEEIGGEVDITSRTLRTL